MLKIKLIILFLFLSIVAIAQQYRTCPISKEIHTVEVIANESKENSPIMALNSNDHITISFDRLFADSMNRLRYRVKMCNADWTENKELLEIDFLDGFSDNSIEDYNSSFNTTMEYTHFELNIPNQDINFKLSGNYIIEVYDEDSEEVMLYACFSVVDKQVNLAYEITTNTDIDSNKEYQQIHLNIIHPNLDIRDPHSDLKLFATQNNRIDSRIKLGSPNYIARNTIGYRHYLGLIFEAGNEYRRFETSSYKTNGMRVAHISYDKPLYSMHIAEDKIRAGKTYSYDQDQNGRFYIRSRDVDDWGTEADYFWTHFTLKSPFLLNNDIYINGDFTYGFINNDYKLEYDELREEYHISLLLKQGLYNYQYLTKKGDKYSPSTTEGNYHDTENEYTIYAYYRPVGQRYDSLIGVQRIASRVK